MGYITKNDYIYDKLKDDIVEGILAPGTRIVISEAAKRFDVSAMPIREALNRLQQDGLVEVSPHVGARVAPFDLAKFKEIMMIRVNLEAMATKLAAEYIDDATIAKLEELHEEMAKCVKMGDGLTYSKLNKEFHLTIYGASPYKILLELIKSLWERSEYSRTVFFMVASRLPQSLAEHDEWLKALKRRDGEQAARILCEQKNASLSLHYTVLEKMQGE